MHTAAGQPFGDRAWLSIVVGVGVEVLIRNNTNGVVHLSLSGPAEYQFAIQPGDHYIRVVAGSYNYTGRGCGGAIKSGVTTISEGDDWEWWCG